MRFRDEVALTLFVQGGGAVATLGAIVLLGATLGPAAQGLFSRTKAEVEFVGALAMMGLPQALFYFVGCARLTVYAAIAFSLAVALAGAACAVIYARFAQPWGWSESLCFALAVGVFALHGSLRSLVLALRSTLWFNVVTATPQLLVVVGVFALILAGGLGDQRVAVTFAVAFAATSAFAAMLLSGQIRVERKVTSPVTPARVLGYGIAAWTTAVAAGLSVVLAMRIVEARVGPGTLGVFSAAMVAEQMLLTPLNYASPLLFRRWLGRPDVRAPMRVASVVAVPMLTVAVFVQLVPWPVAIIDHLGAYAELRYLLGWMLVAAAAEAITRILNVAANAMGHPWRPAGAEFVRLLVLVFATASLPMESGRMIAVIWAAAAVAASLVVAGMHQLSRLGARAVC